MGRYFDDFVIGEEFVTAGRTITETHIVNFAAITGDWNEINSCQGSFQPTHRSWRLDLFNCDGALRAYGTNQGHGNCFLRA